MLCSSNTVEMGRADRVEEVVGNNKPVVETNQVEPSKVDDLKDKLDLDLACVHERFRSSPPSEEEIRWYTAALLATAAGGGSLIEEDREEDVKEEEDREGSPSLEHIGFAPTDFVMPEKVLETFRELKKIPLDEIVKAFESNPKLVACHRMLIFHCLHTSYGDTELTEGDVEDARELAKALKLEDSVVDKFVQAVEKESVPDRVRDELLGYLWQGSSPWPFLKKE